MKPRSPELEKLDYFRGTWNSSGEIKPGPLGAGGNMAMTERNEWMDGGFFLVLRSEFTMAPAINGTAIAFMGYNPDQKLYTYGEFDSLGKAEHSTGTLDGDTWTWTRDEIISGNVHKARYVLQMHSPTAFTVRLDISPDGKRWDNFMEGQATKTIV